MTAPSSIGSPRLRPSITSLPQGLQCEAETKVEINVATISSPLPPPLPSGESPIGKLTPSPLQWSSGTELRGTLPPAPPLLLGEKRRGSGPHTSGRTVHLIEDTVPT